MKRHRRISENEDIKLQEQAWWGSFSNAILASASLHYGVSDESMKQYVMRAGISQEAFEEAAATLPYGVATLCELIHAGHVRAGAEGALEWIPFKPFKPITPRTTADISHYVDRWISGPRAMCNRRIRSWRRSHGYD